MDLSQLNAPVHREAKTTTEALVAKVKLGNGQLIYLAEDYNSATVEKMTALERLNFFKRMGAKIKSTAKKVGGSI